MARRLLFTLLIAGLGAAAFWIARPGPSEDEGLVVHVHVTDSDGKPLENAQTERLFDPGWQVVNREGYRRLTRVRLRADETQPTREAIRGAVRVRAPFYTLRQGFEPEIERRADGSWDARYALHHHGVLRVHVQGTHLGPVKAFLEPDEPLRRWEAMDLGNVARPGSPAAFRIYPGMEHVVIQVVGEADPHGAVAVATRRYFVKPPGPRHIIEKTLVPDEVQPIVGEVRPPEGPRPPTLAGIARVTELAPGGRRIEHDAVPIDAEGNFVVRFVGAGRYEIEAEFDFCGPPPVMTVEGGGSAEIAAQPRPWVVLEHQGFDARSWNGSFLLNETPVRGVRLADGSSTIPLPGRGTWRVRGLAPGTDERPPLGLGATVDASAEGEHRGRLEIEALPHGTLTVKTTKASWKNARGGTVTIGDRTKTLLRGLAEEVVFENVMAGVVTRVAVEWNDPKAAIAVADVEVAANGSAEVTVAYRLRDEIAKDREP